MCLTYQLKWEELGGLNKRGSFQLETPALVSRFFFFPEDFIPWLITSLCINSLDIISTHTVSSTNATEVAKLCC